MYSKVALIATLAVAASAKCTTSYVKSTHHGGYHGNDIKCGFKSHAAIAAFCTKNSRCRGYSWRKNHGWWCAKHKGGKGPHDKTHMWYQKVVKCEKKKPAP